MTSHHAGKSCKGTVARVVFAMMGQKVHPLSKEEQGCMFPITDMISDCCRGRLHPGSATTLRVSYTPITSGTFACEHFAVETAGGRQVGPHACSLCLVFTVMYVTIAVHACFCKKEMSMPLGNLK